MYSGVTDDWLAVDGVAVECTEDAALVELSVAVERFRTRQPAERSPVECAEDLRHFRHLIDLLELDFARRAAAFAQTDEFSKQGSLSPETWIRHECHTSGVAAHAAVCVGDQMPLLPESTAAVIDGRIGYAHLALLASTARDVRESDAEAGFDETPLLTKALAHSVSRFRHDCAHARHAADAEGFLAEHVEAHALRRLELLPTENGVVLRGRLDAAGGAVLRSALEPLARRSGPDDVRDRKQRLADALEEVAHHVLDAGTLPSQGSVRPHLQITASVETLMGLAGAPAAEMQFSSPVPVETLRRFACEANATRIIFDSESQIIDVGRAVRVPSPPVRRALNARDQMCRWPGCERPVSWTSSHHVRHWARNGDTGITNLLLLCYRHHYLAHDGGWSLTLGDDGRVLTVPPQYQFSDLGRTHHLLRPPPRPALT